MSLKNKTKELLLWSQKYTKTDMLYLAKGGFWLTLGDFIASASGLILAITFANTVPKELYGTYKYILAMTGFFTVFSLTGMGTATTRAVAQGYDKTLLSAAKLSIRWSMLSGLASIALGVYYFYNDNTTLGASFLLIALLMPFKDSLGIYSSFFAGKGRFDVIARYNMLNQLLSGGLLILTLLLTQNLFIILIVYFAPRIIINLILFLKTVREIPSDAKEDPAAMSYGANLSILGILSTVAEQLDKILVWNNVGALPLALYSFAIAPVIQARSYLNAIFAIAIPKISKKDIGELKIILPRKILLMALLMAPVVLVYILAAPLIFRILFSQYMDSVFYSQIFALSLLFLPRTFLTESITMHAPSKYLYIFHLTIAVVRIGLLITLVSIYGMLGAIFAYIGSEIFITVLASYIFFRKLKDTPRTAVQQ